MTTEQTIEVSAWTIRATAHINPPTGLRAEQRFRNRVQELEVARVLYAIERGTRPFRNKAGVWQAPTGSPLSGMGRPSGRNVSTVINEMIRTGLLRSVGRHGLVPAPVHVELDGQSACLFPGEDLGPMRARLVGMANMSVADCLACLDVIATGEVRGTSAIVME